MSYSNTVFRQMLSMIPKSQFSSEVDRSGADRYTKHFTSWSQLLVNLYAQASGKKSLRDIETGGDWGRCLQFCIIHDVLVFFMAIQRAKRTATLAGIRPSSQKKELGTDYEKLNLFAFEMTRKETEV